MKGALTRVGDGTLSLVAVRMRSMKKHEFYRKRRETIEILL